MARIVRLALGCALLAAAALPAAGAGTALASSPAPTPASSPRTPFSLSGVLAGRRGPGAAALPVTKGVSYPAGRRSAALVTVGRNVNVIGRHDVVQRAKIGGVSVDTCNPGKHTSANGGASFTAKVIAPISDIPSPLPGATFRDNSFPALALGGPTLHVVWSNWNGSNAGVVYTRSVNGGKTWTRPVTIGGGTGDQFFPWIAARRDVVFASWFNRAGRGDTYSYAAANSSNGGKSWTSPVTVSRATSNVKAGNEFSFPGCAFNFAGDYSGITVDSAGTGHALWTDIHADPLDPAKGGADQDPYTARITASR